MMEILPKAITNAIESLSDLPGIGSRSAERLVLNLMRANSGLDQKIARSLGELKSQVHECETCFHFCESNEKQCVLCRGQNRDPHVLCVVESPLDLIALEKTHEYKGLYHVLHGVISPLNRIGPQDLRLAQLFDRLKKNPDIQEIILATSGNTESDATAMYIAQEIQPFFIGKISRLSRGIPSGGDLDYLDIGTLSRAISERRDFGVFHLGGLRPLDPILLEYNSHQYFLHLFGTPCVHPKEPATLLLLAFQPPFYKKDILLRSIQIDGAPLIFAIDKKPSIDTHCPLKIDRRYPILLNFPDTEKYRKLLP
ncbi:recombination mediator RecR [Candidatus Gracilibacteria bacterium]|nr:recombination mediator RecR [Candidatus Gracilibacteria bacterium]MCF7819594.1 recombination mediator RecR [Candidatus Gracilibacteria bacterium]